MPAKGFARVNVRKMNLDEGDAAGCQGISQGYTCMGVSCRVYDDEPDPLLHRLLHPFHQFVFGVALKKTDLMAGRLGLSPQALIDLLQTGMAVMLRLPLTEQVQIGTIQNQHLSHDYHQ